LILLLLSPHGDSLISRLPGWLLQGTAVGCSYMRACGARGMAICL